MYIYVKALQPVCMYLFSLSLLLCCLPFAAAYIYYDGRTCWPVGQSSASPQLTMILLLVVFNLSFI